MSPVSPRPLLDKLGVKPFMRVAVVNLVDHAFDELLRQRTPNVSSRPRAGTDIVFLGAESLRELARLDALRRVLVPSGAIWVVHRKGRAATLRDIEVFAAAKRAGLVDNKVVSFSPTHTAERLVIPVVNRANHPR